MRPKIGTRCLRHPYLGPKAGDPTDFESKAREHVASPSYSWLDSSTLVAGLGSSGWWAKVRSAARARLSGFGRNETRAGLQVATWDRLHMLIARWKELCIGPFTHTAASADLRQFTGCSASRLIADAH
jgi:hypothetical protein